MKHKYKLRTEEYPGGKEVIFQPVGDAPQREALYLKDPKQFSKYKHGDELSFDSESGEQVKEPKAAKKPARKAAKKTTEKAKPEKTETKE